MYTESLLYRFRNFKIQIDYWSSFVTSIVFHKIFCCSCIKSILAVEIQFSEIVTQFHFRFLKGVAGSLLWLAWSCRQYLAGQQHARSMILFTMLNGAALALELLDFPPLWKAWDAHALWHLTTAPLPLLFYKYVPLKRFIMASL